MNNNSGITVGELKKQLGYYADEDELYMGGLTFYRLKRRGENLVQLEFNEVVYKDSNGTLIINNWKTSF